MEQKSVVNEELQRHHHKMQAATGSFAEEIGVQSRPLKRNFHRLLRFGADLRHAIEARFPAHFRRKENNHGRRGIPRISIQRNQHQGPIGSFPSQHPKLENFYEKQLGGGRQGKIADYNGSMGDVMVRNAESAFKEAVTKHRWNEHHRFRKELVWRQQKGLKS